MSDLDTALANLQTQLVTSLLDRIKSGEATAADLNVARQLLKDNNISASAPPGSPIRNLSDELPFSSHDDFGLKN